MSLILRTIGRLQDAAHTDAGTATVRTTWNGVLAFVVALLLSRVLGIEVTEGDVAAWLPLFAPVLAVFYRLSLAISARWPGLGWVLFGIGSAPRYAADPS